MADGNGQAEARSKRAATLHDVAREAEVSLATVSRTLNGSDRHVKPELRERVRAAADKLRYSANSSAQAVARGGTRTIALVVSDITDPYFSSVASGVIEAAEEAGMHVQIAVSDRSTRRELDLVRVFRGQRPRSIILAGSRWDEDPLDRDLTTELIDFEATGGRVVMISKNDNRFSTVLLDNRQGAFDLAASLTTLGYRRFAVIAGPARLVTARERLGGFRQGLATAGIALDDDLVFNSEFGRNGAHTTALAIDAATLKRVEVIFAVNDVMALGVLSAMRERGVRVPEDVALAGFDDIWTLRDVTPTLTTVRIALDQVGREALRLAEQLPATSLRTERTVLTEVVLRESTPDRR